MYGFGSDFETREPRFLSSEDRGRSSKRLSPPAELTGLAIDPRDSRHIVALGEQRGYVSRDGGSRWRPLAVPGGMVTWTSELGLVAADPAGAIRTADDPTGKWSGSGASAAARPQSKEWETSSSPRRTTPGYFHPVDGGKSWRAILDQ